MADLSSKGRNDVAEGSSPALAVAMAYYQAWTVKDMARAMTYVADDIVCEAPAGRIEGAGRYRAFLAPFARMLTGSGVIAAFGDDETALLMYEPHITLVGRSRQRVSRDQRHVGRDVQDHAGAERGASVMRTVQGMPMAGQGV